MPEPRTSEYWVRQHPLEVCLQQDLTQRGRTQGSARGTPAAGSRTIMSEVIPVRVWQRQATTLHDYCVAVVMSLSFLTQL